MNTIADFQRFILKYLREADMPMPQPQLEQVSLQAFVPRPLKSDVHEAIEGLEREGFIQGERDDLDKKLITWTLTDKGRHKAKQLG